MRSLLSRLFMGLCLTGLLAFQARSAFADDYRYPAGLPVMTITLPDGWPTNEQVGPAKMLLCSPPDDSTYTISVISLPTTGGDADLKNILTRITQAGAAGAGLTDIKVSEPKEVTVGKGTRVFTIVTASGKHDDGDGAFTYYAFRLPGYRQIVRGGRGWFAGDDRRAQDGIRDGGQLHSACEMTARPSSIL